MNVRETVETTGEVVAEEPRRPGLTHQMLRTRLLEVGLEDPNQAQNPTHGWNNNDEGGRPLQPLQGEKTMNEPQPGGNDRSVADRIRDAVGSDKGSAQEPLRFEAVGDPFYIDIGKTAAKAAVVTVIAVGGALVFHKITKPATPELEAM